MNINFQNPVCHKQATSHTSQDKTPTAKAARQETENALEKISQQGQEALSNFTPSRKRQVVSLAETRLAKKQSLDKITHGEIADPNGLEALYNLGVVAEEQNKLDEAKKLFEDVLNIDNRHTNALNGLGRILVKQNKHVEDLTSYAFYKSTANSHEPTTIWDA
jgi:tetratricopeptide (TPR) repeat protein